MATAPQPTPSKPKRKVSVTLLSWGSLVLAFAESLCVAAVALSGVRVALGMTSLIAATAGGPAHGWHRDAFRIPLLTLGGIGAVVVLLLAGNEDRMRRNPSAAWRLQPLTPEQKRSRRIQIWLSVLTLLLIAAELMTHPWFHHEV